MGLRWFTQTFHQHPFVHCQGKVGIAHTSKWAKKVAGYSNQYSLFPAPYPLLASTVVAAEHFFVTEMLIQRWEAGWLRLHT
jgi:hypothetical protein